VAVRARRSTRRRVSPASRSWRLRSFAGRSSGRAGELEQPHPGARGGVARERLADEVLGACPQLGALLAGKQRRAGRVAQGQARAGASVLGLGP